MSTCPNCGNEGPHYVPPGFGSGGFFACKSLTPTESEKETK